MTTTTTFSLLQLPKKALKMVLTQDIDVMIGFSFCSSHSKSIVQGLRIHYLHIKCHFSRQHALCLMFEDTPLWSSGYYNTSDHVIEERRNGQKCDCDLEAYIDHVYSVLNQPPFDVEIYNTEEVHKTYELFVNMLKDVQIRRTTISAYESPSLLNDEMFCKRFILPVQQIDLCQKLFETSVQSHRLLIQNVDYLGISLRYDEKLNSLHAMNSAFISITNYRREFTRNYLNIYLKHWINGLNPRLEYIEIESLVPGEISMTSFFDEVFNGINKEAMKKDYRKQIKYQKTHLIIVEQDNEITRGFKIAQHDGSTAEIWFHIPYPMVDNYRFEMFIEECH